MCIRISNCNCKFNYLLKVSILKNNNLQMNPTEAIAEFVFYVGFVLTMLTQIFLPCYFGNEITLKSEKLSKAVYFSNWPGQSKRFRQLVLVYMELLKSPKQLIVGKIFGLSLDTFLAVINYQVVQ